MSDSPIEQLLDAVDRHDAEGVVALAAPDIRMLVVDGRRAEGADALRELMVEFLGSLRRTEHRITAQWHVGDVWIAEVDATYELQDYLELKDLPRAFVVRTGPDGIAEMRVYGAHEHPLSEHRTGDEGMWIGGRWVPPL